VDTDFLLSQQVSPWNDMPVWVRRGDLNKAFDVSNNGVKKGLTSGRFPIPRATLEWFRKQPPKGKPG
jgi:hypothetical protein